MTANNKRKPICPYADTAENLELRNDVLETGQKVYDITNKKYKTGDGIKSWNELPFDSVGTSGDVDLSGYATTTQLDNKVDKVEGKGLSSNDYTTAEKEKLAALPTVTDDYYDIINADEYQINAKILNVGKGTSTGVIINPNGITLESNGGIVLGTDNFNQIVTNEGTSLQTTLNDLPQYDSENNILDARKYNTIYSKGFNVELNGVEGVSMNPNGFYTGTDDFSTIYTNTTDLQTVLDNFEKEIPSFLTDDVSSTNYVLTLEHNKEIWLGEQDRAVTLSISGQNVFDGYKSTVYFKALELTTIRATFIHSWSGDNCENSVFTPVTGKLYEVIIRKLGNDWIARVFAY